MMPRPQWAHRAWLLWPSEWSRQNFGKDWAAAPLWPAQPTPANANRVVPAGRQVAGWVGHDYPQPASMWVQRHAARSLNASPEWRARVEASRSERSRLGPLSISKTPPAPDGSPIGHVLSPRSLVLLPRPCLVLASSSPARFQMAALTYLTWEAQGAPLLSMTILSMTTLSRTILYMTRIPTLLFWKRPSGISPATTLSSTAAKAAGSSCRAKIKRSNALIPLSSRKRWALSIHVGHCSTPLE